MSARDAAELRMAQTGHKEELEQAPQENLLAED